MGTTYTLFLKYCTSILFSCLYLNIFQTLFVACLIFCLRLAKVWSSHLPTHSALPTFSRLSPDFSPPALLFQWL